MAVSFLISIVPHSNAEDSPDKTTFGEFVDWFKSVDKYLPILVGSFIVGMIGSGAYYAALRLGYTGGDQRDWFLKNFGGPKGKSAFIFIGGAVATVFQLPELGGFVPIQAFVLGITWPFIVSQYVSKVSAPRPKEIEELMGGSL